MSNHMKIVMNDIMLAREVSDLDSYKFLCNQHYECDINIRQSAVRALSDQLLKWQQGHRA